jgi:hypothetical protein
MKKIFLTILTILLLISTTLVFAGSEKGLGQTISNENKGAENAIQEQVQEKVQYKVGTIVKAINEKKHEMAQEIKQIRERLQNCKNVDDENCVQIRKEARIQAKDHLLKTSENALNFLEKAKEQIRNSKLSEDKKTEIIEKITENHSSISEEVEKVRLTGVEKSETIKASITEMKKKWNNARNEIKFQLHNKYLNQFRNVFIRTEILKEKLEKEITKFEEKGINTAEIAKNEFYSKLDEAKKLFEEAEKNYEEAKTHAEENSKIFLHNARENMKLSQEKIKESTESLKEILKKLKDLKNEETNNVE